MAEAGTRSQNGASPGADGARPIHSQRLIALVGPFQSGKTSLLEALLARMGAVQRQGTVADRNSVGDGSAEARDHQMSVEASFATGTFLGESFTFVDLPGSIEFAQELDAILPAVDTAIVVCEADEKKVPALQLTLRALEERRVPHLLFVNKIDKADKRIRETLEMLRPASRIPLLLRQIPIWRDGIVIGFVDLALERAFIYREHAPSTVAPLEGEDLSREKEARFTMLEKLADYDDALMENLLDDIEPPRDRVFDDLARELREQLVCPVLIGSATHAYGALRLLKALRHDVGDVTPTLERLGVQAANGEAVAQVLKTYHTTHGGKLSVARVLAGEVQDGTMLTGPSGKAERVAGVFTLFGQASIKAGTARVGDTVALGRLDGAKTGETLSSGKAAPDQLASAPTRSPVLSLAVRAADRKDDVKLGHALSKLTDEDPSLSIEHKEGGEVVLSGQGEMHLRVAAEKIAQRFGVKITTAKPQVGYLETIRKPVSHQRGRHRKQSGGHGQFGDVVIDVKPLSRGSGFHFADTITGGVVPKQYIPSVEEGARDALKRGPLGFPVVDVEVVLTDGSYHTVDSSDMAFQTAGRIAVSEALPNAQPVLLEPIRKVEIAVPSEATAKANAIVSARRGQILGFQGREEWPGWDMVSALIPEAEIGDLIVELRSATAGVGTFTAAFDHMAELSGRPAEQIVAGRREATGN